jgi:hypothetical protein
LGVVLVDAGSTITHSDLETIQALYRAGIPVQILLSKADLLSLEDRERMAGYVKQSIAEEYRIDLPVHPVSAIPEHREMLERWFKTEILPLYEQCRELKSASVRRKVGALRDAVVAALTIQVQRSKGTPGVDGDRLREVEAKLRKTTGRISETRIRLEREIRALEGASGLLLERAAIRLAESWASNHQDNAATSDLILFESIVSDIHHQATLYRKDMEGVAREAHSELESAAKALGFPSGPSVDEFLSVIRAMPVFDFAAARTLPTSGPTWMRFFGNPGLRASARRLVNPRLEKPLAEALFVYSGVLREWTTSVLKVIEKQFASFADGYRAQAERSQSTSTLGSGEAGVLLDDVRELGGAPSATDVSVGSTD